MGFDSFLITFFSTLIVKYNNIGKSDAFRLKKCVKVLSSFTNEQTDLIEITADFKENVPQNEATLVYANETTLVLQLRKGAFINEMFS